VYASGQSLGIIGWTKDGGTVWNAFPVDVVVSSLAINRLNPSRVWAGTFGEGILRGSGSSWSFVNSGLASLDVRCLLPGSGGSTTFFAGTRSGPDGFLSFLDPKNIFYFPQIADGNDGKIRFQTTLILVNTGEETSAKVEFFDSAGSPMALNLEGLGTASSFNMVLKSGQSLSTMTPGEGAFKIGYARVSTSHGVGGTAVFSRTDPVAGNLLYEAGVPASHALSHFVFMIDSLGEKDTGIALVHPFSDDAPATDAEITIALSEFDFEAEPPFTQIAEEQIQLAPGEHLAKFVREIFPKHSAKTREMQGILSVTSTHPLVSLTLRQRDDPDLEFPAEVPSLTPFPVMPPHSFSSELYFPQIADGLFGVFGSEQFQTTFALANAGETIAFIDVAFYDSTGQLMDLNLGDLGTGDGIEFWSLPHQYIFAQTTGEGTQKVGYATLISDSPFIGGTAVFTQTDVDSGIALYEAGVAATIPRKRFTVFVDSIGTKDTGIAMVNTAAVDAELTLRLYDTGFNLIGEEELTLEPGRHLPRFVFQLFPDHRDTASEMQGIVTVTSTEPLAAVTLRQDTEAGKVFPEKVPTLATFPVIPGVPE
jgi:hypothetical protein